MATSRTDCPECGANCIREMEADISAKNELYLSFKAKCVKCQFNIDYEHTAFLPNHPSPSEMPDPSKDPLRPLCSFEIPHFFIKGDEVRCPWGVCRFMGVSTTMGGIWYLVETLDGVAQGHFTRYEINTVESYVAKI